MRRERNTKIIATLGPASSSPEMIRGLFEVGADVFRLNFSHGSHADHKSRLDIIREHRHAPDPAGRVYPQGGPHRCRHADPALRQCADSEHALP